MTLIFTERITKDTSHLIEVIVVAKDRSRRKIFTCTVFVFAEYIFNIYTISCWYMHIDFPSSDIVGESCLHVVTSLARTSLCCEGFYGFHIKRSLNSFRAIS